jgi:hypothetical protein
LPRPPFSSPGNDDNPISLVILTVTGKPVGGQLDATRLPGDKIARKMKT